MCLAHPAKIISIDNEDNAMVELGEVKKQISLALVSDVKLGDYVLIHVGYALNKLSQQEAKNTLNIMKQLS
ncbi:MAG: HypC/HybG/HupF family hydrogenase formation chaperone [Candidatus Thioglobus sp.]|jgi:hydrogenase expression/formation protein HypC